MIESKKSYIDRCKAYIDFMLSRQQWSGVDCYTVQQWINNFNDVRGDDRYYIYELLTKMIYLSEKDVIMALSEGIHKCVCYDAILECQKQRDFSMSSHALSGLVKTEINSTCFTPLSNADSPYESGNYIVRLLVQESIIPKSNVKYTNDVAAFLAKEEIKRLVIVDDCIGSGAQIKEYWEDTECIVDGVNKPIISICKELGITVYYLSLYGYKNSIAKLNREIQDLHIICVRYLDDTQRVFDNNSYFWKDRKEMENAKRFFEPIVNNQGISLLGYNDMDFAFIMHKTIPDWSLPLLWKSRANWRPLMRRKNSDE